MPEDAIALIAAGIVIVVGLLGLTVGVIYGWYADRQFRKRRRTIREMMNADRRNQ